MLVFHGGDDGWLEAAAGGLTHSLPCLGLSGLPCHALEKALARLVVIRTCKLRGDRDDGLRLAVVDVPWRTCLGLTWPDLT